MRKTLVKLLSIAALAAVTLTPALAADKDKGKMATKSLYDRLGKKASIVKVVDEFVSRCAADKRINAFFAKTAADPARLKKFKANLVDQICQASGGPCKYTGKDMKSAHAGMGISSADFGALVEDLVGALDKFKVDEKSKSDLLGALGPMKGDIVEKP
jgi:hemoglobin